MREPRQPGDASRAGDGRGAAPRAPYRVEVLEAPELLPGGIGHGRQGRRTRLAWSEVEVAVAAEVGEPQGVRTIVFDLVRREGAGWAAARLDAEPGGEATALARALDAALGSAAHPSLKSLATDGIPSRWYPDLPGFEEATRADLE